MNSNAAKAYFQTQVTTTTPGNLVVMLFDGAIKFLRQAKEKIAEKDVKNKGILISKAMDIISELDGSLNMQKGGSLAENLHKLYFYCSTRLLQANLYMSTAKIDETIGILSSLRSAFAEIATPGGTATAKPMNLNNSGLVANAAMQTTLAAVNSHMAQTNQAGSNASSYSAPVRPVQANRSESLPNTAGASLSSGPAALSANASPANKQAATAPVQSAPAPAKTPEPPRNNRIPTFIGAETDSAETAAKAQGIPETPRINLTPSDILRRKIAGAYK